MIHDPWYMLLLLRMCSAADSDARYPSFSIVHDKQEHDIGIPNSGGNELWTTAPVPPEEL